MVGEIRDSETLEIAIHSAMTGHLVLSTLHTNSAAGALPRMLDMGAEPFLVASTTNVIVAQRLVRKLCPECRTEYSLSEKETKVVGANFNLEEIMTFLKSCKDLKGKIKPTDKWENLKFFKAKGCEQCNHEGYHGRAGIYEVLEIDPEIQKLITQRVSADELEKKAKEKGMATMVMDGFFKAVQGTTSIEEILRVTKE